MSTTTATERAALAECESALSDAQAKLSRMEDRLVLAFQQDKKDLIPVYEEMIKSSTNEVDLLEDKLKRLKAAPPPTPPTLRPPPPPPPIPSVAQLIPVKSTASGSTSRIPQPQHTGTTSSKTKAGTTGTRQEQRGQQQQQQHRRPQPAGEGNYYHQQRRDERRSSPYASSAPPPPPPPYAIGSTGMSGDRGGGANRSTGVGSRSHYGDAQTTGRPAPFDSRHHQQQGQRSPDQGHHHQQSHRSERTTIRNKNTTGNSGGAEAGKEAKEEANSSSHHPQQQWMNYFETASTTAAGAGGGNNDDDDDAGSPSLKYVLGVARRRKRPRVDDDGAADAARASTVAAQEEEGVVVPTTEVMEPLYSDESENNESEEDEEECTSSAKAESTPVPSVGEGRVAAAAAADHDTRNIAAVAHPPPSSPTDAPPCEGERKPPPKRTSGGVVTTAREERQDRLDWNIVPSNYRIPRPASVRNERQQYRHYQHSHYTSPSSRATAGAGGGGGHQDERKEKGCLQNTCGPNFPLDPFEALLCKYSGYRQLFVQEVAAALDRRKGNEKASGGTSTSNSSGSGSGGPSRQEIYGEQCVVWSPHQWPILLRRGVFREAGELSGYIISGLKALQQAKGGFAPARTFYDDIRSCTRLMETLIRLQREGALAMLNQRHTAPPSAPAADDGTNSSENREALQRMRENEEEEWRAEEEEWRAATAPLFAVPTALSLSKGYAEQLFALGELGKAALIKLAHHCFHECKLEGVPPLAELHQGRCSMPPWLYRYFAVQHRRVCEAEQQQQQQQQQRTGPETKVAWNTDRGV